MQISRRHLIAAMAGAVALPRHALAQGKPLEVVATTGMIADTARQIGLSNVSVRALMGPGVDPHGYRQTRSDIVALTRADLVLWHGLYLEAQMEDFLIDLGKRRAVTAVADSLPPEDLLANPQYPDRFDPHVWMAPELWSKVANVISAELAEAMPDRSGELMLATEAYQKQIATLHEYCRMVLTSVPEKARVLVTAHDAFAYFGRAYGFEVLGIQGISTASEAGLNRIGELVDILVERQIGAVFVESSVSERNILALVEGAAARGHTLTVGGELFSDAMGPDGSYEGTYIGMLDHNATVIARALGGTVPEGGMNGKLAVRS